MADSVQDQIHYLVRRRFPGGSSAMRVANKRANFGAPIPPEAALQKAAISAYRAELQELTKEALTLRWEEERAKERVEILERAQQADRTLFHRPDQLADFTHWAKAAHWTIEEAVALSLGKAPEHLTWEVVKSSIQISPFAKDYGRRRELAHRALSTGTLQAPIIPAAFVEWAKGIDLEIPPELEAAVSARSPIQDWKSEHAALKARFDELMQQYEALELQKREQSEACAAEIADLKAKLEAATTAERALSARERDSLLKMVIGMAIGGYSYDPKAERSVYTAEIADDLAKNGVPLDVDTVRKWLKEAADLVPGPDE